MCTCSSCKSLDSTTKFIFLREKNGKRATTKWRERSEKQKQKKIHTNTKAARESAIHGSNPVIKSVLCVRNTLATTIQKLNIDFVLVLPLLLLLFHSFRCLNTDMLTIAHKHTHKSLSLSHLFTSIYIVYRISSSWIIKRLGQRMSEPYNWSTVYCVQYLQLANRWLLLNSREKYVCLNETEKATATATEIGFECDCPLFVRSQRIS